MSKEAFNNDSYAAASEDYGKTRIAVVALDRSNGSDGNEAAFLMLQVYPGC